jgi:flagellar hook protein FlgE
MGVSSAMYIGLSGLNSFGTALSVVSDNVANANTTAFKTSSVRFGDMVSSYYSTQSRDTDRAGSGSAILGLATNFGQGSILNTSDWTDLAINGEGFFNVRLLDAGGAPTGQTMYTRDGGLHVDQDGFLVNSQGYGVLGSDGNPIRVEANPAIPLRTNYTFDANGQLWGTPIAGGAAETIGLPLRITTFPNQDGLLRQGGNLYSLGPETGAAIDSTANTSATGQILSRSIEGSNVDLATEMVNMIIYQADFNANSKSITTGDNMVSTVVNMIR